MTSILEDIRHSLQAEGTALSTVQLPKAILLAPGAVHETAKYMRNGGYTAALLVTDAPCFAAAGEELLADLQAEGIAADVVCIEPNRQGDVVADEASVVQVLMASQRSNASVCIALGSGTIHDIVRYAAYTLKLPFLSVPTAPSVDGFTSKGAPLIIREQKITVPAIGPEAIFADTDILSAAPAALIAAGYGDMLGKYTSLLDWKIGRLTADEPYDSLVAGITERALRSCVDHTDAIGRRTREGVTTLMRSLIDSGIAMLIFGQSHPASGAEHHVSHYWEMDFIRTGRKQLLHGAKVGVACTIVAGRYKRIAETGLPALPVGVELDAPRRAAETHWTQIAQWIRALPAPEALGSLLTQVGGPSALQELGIDEELKNRALAEADRVRPNRTTLLRLYNEALRLRS